MITRCVGRATRTPRGVGDVACAPPSGHEAAGGHEALAFRNHDLSLRTPPQRSGPGASRGSAELPSHPSTPRAARRWVGGIVTHRDRFRQGLVQPMCSPKSWARSWALWTQPHSAIAYMLIVELGTMVAVSVAVARGGPVGGRDWVRAAVLLVFASAHMYLSRRQEETRRNRMVTVHVDLTSIWTFPAALVLPIPLAVLVILAVRAQRWFVARRPLYRFVFGTAVCALGALGVRAVIAWAGGPTWADARVLGSPRDLAAVGVAGVLYVVTQIALVGIAVALHGPRERLRAALGSGYDNGLEAMTVALGLVTAVLLVYAPAIVVVMVPLAVIGNRFAEIRQLQVDVRTDPKTGLLNMRGWREAATKEFARADRTGTPIALLMIDLDHFKSINDTWGHPAGDDMLVAVAGVLRDETRVSDVVGRFGGEEFVLLLPDSTALTAGAAAERIRARVAALSVATTDKRGGPVVISGRTTSIGVAGRPEDASTLQDLLRMADRAVYDAKEGGRDQVRLAHSHAASGSDPRS